MTRVERVAAATATLVVLLLVVTDAVPFLRGPAPYPPEWQWGLRAEPPAASRYAWPVLVAAGLIGLLAASEGRWFRARPRRGAAVVLAGATVLGGAFQLAVLGMEPQGALRTLLARVLSRTDTAYYTVAVSSDARDPRAFLDRHAELLVDLRKTARHAATHPPGPVLYYRAWIAACEASPGLTRAALRAAGLAPGEGPTQRAPHTPASVAGALCGGALILWSCAAACVPIALLLRVLRRDELAAARIAGLWPLVPGAALMSPQFDQALALPVAGATALLALAAAAVDGSAKRTVVNERGGASPRRAVDTRLRLPAAALAGTLAFVATFLSYGAAAFVVLGGLAVAGALGWRAALRPAAVAVATLGAWWTLTIALGHEPLTAARTALEFHRAAYTAPRRYALWLAFNPVDLAIFLGAPVVAVGLLRASRRLDDPLPRFRAVFLVGLVALLLTGTVRGEIGRIGVPLMALALPGALGDAEMPARDAAWMALLLAMLCVVLRASWVLP